MTDKPNISIARMRENAWESRRHEAQARTWVFSAVETVWSDARNVIRDALEAVDPGDGVRPEVHLHEAEQFLRAARLWRDNLLNPPTEAGRDAPLSEIARVLESVPGQEAVRSAEDGVKAAEDAVAWAREQTGVKA